MKRAQYCIMLDKKELQNLIEKYKKGECSEPEKQKLEYWFHVYELNSLVGLSEESLERISLEIWKRVSPAVREHKISAKRKIHWWWGAASFFLIISSIYYFSRKESISTPTEIVSHDVLPAGNKAVLKWSNGKVLVLREDMSMLKVDKDKIMYEDGSVVFDEKMSEDVMLEISTPRGGKYVLVLPDQTKVWINSASTLKYPSNFSGKERMVSLIGEAYFEVSHNHKQPFQVKMNNSKVTVTGTKFNVMAYPDEPEMYVSLLEGGVNVSSKTSLRKLFPGQQAILKENGGIQSRIVDVSSVIAWKDGYFSFEDQDIKQIMKQISRWYDVDVEYKGNISAHTYGIVYTRTKGLKELLKFLETFGDFEFDIQGRRIIVSEK